LLQAAAETGQWWWAVVIQIGGIFTSGYVLLVLAHALAPSDHPVTVRVPLSRIAETAALIIALCSLLLGLFPWDSYLSVPTGAFAKPLALQTLAKAFWPILGGVVLAILFGRWRDRPASTPLEKILVKMLDPIRRPTVAFGSAIEFVDGVFRQWSVAVMSLLVVAFMFGTAMLCGH